MVPFWYSRFKHRLIKLESFVLVELFKEWVSMVCKQCLDWCAERVHTDKSMQHATKICTTSSLFLSRLRVSWTFLKVCKRSASSFEELILRLWQILKNLPLRFVLETLRNMPTLEWTTPQYSCLLSVLQITQVNSLLLIVVEYETSTTSDHTW